MKELFVAKQGFLLPHKVRKLIKELFIIEYKKEKTKLIYDMFQRNIS
ncbi:hypothetical protein [Helicobacter sp. MIT 14-3879]|nr:hypothetical protein [Helicobacter sp. MIT 14-3879]